MRLCFFGCRSWILGRKSVDIIKCGGYKISALEIEEVLREHPAIAECAVVGVPDDEYGERVAVAVVLRAESALELHGVRAWARERLAGYKVPTRMQVVATLPRNAMGKIVKPEVAQLLGRLGGQAEASSRLSASEHPEEHPADQGSDHRHREPPGQDPVEDPPGVFRGGCGRHAERPDGRQRGDVDEMAADVDGRGDGEGIVTTSSKT